MAWGGQDHLFGKFLVSLIHPLPLMAAWWTIVGGMETEGIWYQSIGTLAPFHHKLLCDPVQELPSLCYSFLTGTIERI